MITLPTETLLQDVEKKKAESLTPHFLSLDQDIVAGSQEEKCGLKYVICAFAVIELSLNDSPLYSSCAYRL